MGKDQALRTAVIFLAMLFGFHPGQCQEITGRVTDSLGKPLSAVTVTLYTNTGDPLAYALTRMDGIFVIRNPFVREAGMILEFRHIAHRMQRQIIDSAVFERKQPLLVVMSQGVVDLKEIVIRGEPPILIRSDTISFNAAHFRREDVRKLDDLLRRLPGFAVDNNGRLSFNGRPVSKLLIEGDDLAGSAYSLVTKNMDAQWVERVEVIDNFNENRLRRQMERSDRVGVNIRIGARYKMKPSGTLEAGSSANGRYSADLSSLFVGKSKWMFFAGANNVARDPSANVGYYQRLEAGSGADVEEDPGAAWLLETGVIHVPAIGQQYTEDNNDVGVTLMNTLKWGRSVKLNMIAGVSERRLERSAGSVTYTKISDQEKWITANEMKSRFEGRHGLARVVATIDGGGQNISRLKFSIRSSSELNDFLNYSSGALDDSLQEKLFNRDVGWNLHWEHSLKKSYGLWQMAVSWQRGYAEQNLQNQSYRYWSYYGLDSSYHFNIHGYSRFRDDAQISLTMTGRSRRLNYELGIKGQLKAADHLSHLLFQSGQQGPDYRKGAEMEAQQRDLHGLARGSLVLGKSGQLAGELTGGFQDVRQSSDRSIAFAYLASLTYNHRFSLVRNFRIAARQERWFREFGQLHPRDMLSGNGIVLNGIDFGGPAEVFSVDMSLHHNNLQRQQNFSFLGGLKVYHKGYALYTEVTPALAVLGSAMSKRNHSLHASSSAEFFSRSLRSRIGGSVFFHYSSVSTMLNGQTGESVSGSLNLAAWWVTGFRAPINLEFRAQLGASGARWESETSNVNVFHRWTTKLKLNGKRGLYAAAIWNIHRLSPGSRFQSMDIHVTRSLGSKLKMTVTGVNLLNQSTMAERNVMPYIVSGSETALVRRYVMLSLSLPLSAGVDKTDEVETGVNR